MKVLSSFFFISQSWWSLESFLSGYVYILSHRERKFLKVSGASHGQNISDFRFRYFQLPVSGLEIPTGSGKLPHAIARFELYIPKQRCPNYQRFTIDLPEIHWRIYICFYVSLVNLWQISGSLDTSVPKVSCSMTDHLKIDPIFKPVKVLLSIMLGRLRDATLERIQEIKMFIQSKGNWTNRLVMHMYS